MRSDLLRKEEKKELLPLLLVLLITWTIGTNPKTHKQIHTKST